ncbi:MAG: tail fiber domain-containing protein [Verrucomicrobia bacterium]|nr:tail fiber domain-containing protein [Verrucomicrobiota bacterium]
MNDGNAREKQAPVDPHEVLEKLAKIEITTWNYKADGPQVRHMGPMAQDFYAAFGLSDTDKRIHVEDSMGVAFASIQALKQMIETNAERITQLETQIQRIERSNA